MNIAYIIQQSEAITAYFYNSSCIPYHNDINPYCRQGQDFGDEYFAELDMIESVEGRKEGYESDVDEGQYNLT